MREGSRRKKHGFTLVELLVVIAIIAILISLFLPVVMKARRKAAIFAAPLAYYAARDASVHVTDQTFTWNVPIVHERDWDYGYSASCVGWSPSGYRLGIGMSQTYIMISTPLTGELVKHVQMPDSWIHRSKFVGWVDDSSFLERTHDFLYVRDAGTGAVIRTVPYDEAIPWGSPFVRMPLDSPAPYIAMYNGGIHLVGKNFRAGRAIWRPIDSTFSPHAESPDGSGLDIDQDGRWVAWSMSMEHTGAIRCLAIKRLDDPVEVEPTLLPLPPMAYFLQWTGDGNLLCSSSDGPPQYNERFLILDKSGKVVRNEICADRPWNNTASWRKKRYY